MLAQFVQGYQIYISPVVRIGMPIIAVVGLWVALRRAGLTPKARMIGIVITGVLAVWYVTMDLLGRSGFLAANWTFMRPLGWAIATLWLVPLTRSQVIGAALDAIPSWWLVVLQVYRTGGGLVWLAAWQTGRVPNGLWSGIGDVMVGILAVATAAWIASGVRGGRTAGIAWNMFGVLDFAGGFVVAFFVPYNLAYPGVMIPAMLAPLSLDFHGLSLRQLLRAPARQSRPSQAPVATAH